MIWTAEGGPFAFGTTFAQITFSGGLPVNPSVTLNPPGSKWRIILHLHVYYDNATIAASTSIQTKLVCTNNSPGDVPDSIRTFHTGVKSSAAESWFPMSIEVLYTVSQTGGDVIVP